MFEYLVFLRSGGELTRTAEDHRDGQPEDGIRYFTLWTGDHMVAAFLLSEVVGWSRIAIDDDEGYHHADGPGGGDAVYGLPVPSENGGH